jgi:peptidoglycan/LPS O-acetylase OafA/YrhL
LTSALLDPHAMALVPRNSGLAPASGYGEQGSLAYRSGIKWQPHIDGLRAISVVSVLLYHANILQFSGGFVGVDVFFVISGFLISTIIYGDIALYGRLRVVSFYERRARRILPVFIVVTAATITAGGFLLLPGQFTELSQSAIYAVGFAANIFFYASSNYFSQNGSIQPLLHYWSLGVEEQFYLTFPFFVLVCSRLGPRLVGAGIIAVAALSLVLAEYSVLRDPPAAFYLPLPRAWELMAGCILALPDFPFPQRRRACEALAAIGLGLITVAVFFYDSQTTFPGLSTLAPVLGAAFILCGCHRCATLTGALLSVRALRLVGLWSYSIYMVHWPLFAFTRLYSPHPRLLFNVIIVVLSIGVGAFSYRFIETPFRSARGIPCSRGVLGVAGLTALASLVGVSLLVVLTGGFLSRFPPKVRDVLAYSNYLATVRPAWRYTQCFLRDAQTWDGLDQAACLHPAHPSALLWGDSHAGDLYPALFELFRRHGVQLSQANAAGCAPILAYIVGAHPNCHEFNERVFDWINQNRPDKVILSALWPLDRTSIELLEQTIARMNDFGIFVVLIGETPVYANPVPDILATRLIRGETDVRAESQDTGGDANSDFFLGKRFLDRPNVIYLSPWQTLCEGSECPLAGDDGMPLLMDKDHFTERGAQLLIHRLFDSRGVEERVFGRSQ